MLLLLCYISYGHLKRTGLIFTFVHYYTVFFVDDNKLLIIYRTLTFLTFKHTVYVHCFSEVTTKFFGQSSSFTTAFFFNIPKSCTFSRKLLWAVSNFALSTSFFSSSISLFSFALLFWNHVITCAFVSPKFDAISSRSAGLRYFW